VARKASQIVHKEAFPALESYVRSRSAPNCSFSSSIESIMAQTKLNTLADTNGIFAARLQPTFCSCNLPNLQVVLQPQPAWWVPFLSMSFLLLAELTRNHFPSYLFQRSPRISGFPMRGINVVLKWIAPEALLKDLFCQRPVGDDFSRRPRMIARRLSR